MKTLYFGLLSTIRMYWRTYGGLRALLLSPYLHGSIAYTFLVTPLWYYRGAAWFDTAVSVIPSMLGFSVAGYAILLAFGDEKFRKIISGSDSDGKPSPFMVVNASFVHFILVSAVALLFAIFAKAWNVQANAWAGVGVLLFSYSIATAVAAAFAILHVASWTDLHAKQNK